MEKSKEVGGVKCRKSRKTIRVFPILNSKLWRVCSCRKSKKCSKMSRYKKSLKIGKPKGRINILLKLEEQDPVNIFGYIDAMKLQSCMTLFMQVDESGLYQKVLDKFYNGRVDEKTLELIKK